MARTLAAGKVPAGARLRAVGRDRDEIAFTPNVRFAAEAAAV